MKILECFVLGSRSIEIITQVLFVCSSITPRRRIYCRYSTQECVLFARLMAEIDCKIDGEENKGFNARRVDYLI